MYFRHNIILVLVIEIGNLIIYMSFNFILRNLNILLIFDWLKYPFKMVKPKRKEENQKIKTIIKAECNFAPFGEKLCLL